MIRQVRVSAPGKLMLFGEHAVVYGRPCIVTAVDQRMEATVELTNQPIFHLHAPDVQVENYTKPMSELGKGNPSTDSTGLRRAQSSRLRRAQSSRSPQASPSATSGSTILSGSGQGIPKGAKFVEIAVKNFMHIGGRPTRLKGLKVTTKSEFNSQLGFGSSSASTVCIIKALSELTGAKLDNKAIFDLSYKTVLDIQGKGSGFDVAAATFGGTLYYVIGGKVLQPLNTSSLPIIVGYSGIKADTVALVNEVKKGAKKYPKVIDEIYDSIGKLVDLAKKAILKQDWQTLGELANFNQGYLEALGVGSRKLSDMVYAAREAGAYGAKLSGAGKGDCMIAIAPQKSKEAVEQAISTVGGQVLDVKTNAEGVKVENG